MKSEVIVVHADRVPLQGIEHPGPHQLFKNPRIAWETRLLEALQPNDIRVQILYAGICGTDVHLSERNPETGYIRTSAPADIPPEGRVIGHEGVGRVLETGANVQHLHKGAIVTFESIIVCHYCEVCRKGNFNQCRNAKLLGLEKDGILGTVVDVPALLAHDVTSLIHNEQDLKAAACVEPAGVAYVACQNTKITAGDCVVIFGAGPIGLFAGMLSRLIFGASSVHIVDPVAFRREAAKKWCDYVYTVDEFFANPPAGVDVVIEASGVLDNVNKIFRRINANGRVALLARSGVPLLLDAVDHMITNAVLLTGSRGHLCGAFGDILRLYQEGKLPLDEVVTTVVNGLGEALELFNCSEKILHENCKVLVKL
ncbi:MAG: alcohol dehydrogenase [Candidatus Electrothrix sp. GM3_4]|nr:alcohol dehydrogenase [Candidatus Electrothrix sp. GM3_4]